MLVLCGSPISNYYNKVKLALLEKGVAFTEELRRHRRQRRKRVLARLAARQDPVHPHRRTARCAKARRSSNTSRRAIAEPPLAAARSVRRRQGAQSWRSSSTCTWSWSRASSTRRRSSAAA